MPLFVVIFTGLVRLTVRLQWGEERCSVLRDAMRLREDSSSRDA